LNSTLKFDEVLDRLLLSLEKVIPHDLANIMLVDESGTARIVRARGYDAAGLEKVAQLNLQVIEIPTLLKMAISGAPLVIPDTTQGEGWVNLDGMEWIRSYLAAPIQVKGKLVGYINLDSARPNVYDKSHIERLQIFADQAAIAIENAHMFEKVEQMAIADTLTGLYNRRHFYDLGDREIERNKRYHSPLSILLIDLDHFKKINDLYGHDTGDHVLQEVTRSFANALRKMDIPGRLGGEEFVILLPETQVDQAVYVAERLRQVVENTRIKAGSELVSITASIGVATMNPDIPNLQALINSADKAMYLAKDGGRNRVVAASI